MLHTEIATLAPLQQLENDSGALPYIYRAELEKLKGQFDIQKSCEAKDTWLLDLFNGEPLYNAQYVKKFYADDRLIFQLFCELVELAHPEFILDVWNKSHYLRNLLAQIHKHQISNNDVDNLFLLTIKKNQTELTRKLLKMMRFILIFKRNDTDENYDRLRIDAFFQALRCRNPILHDIWLQPLKASIRRMNTVRAAFKEQNAWGLLRAVFEDAPAGSNIFNEYVDLFDDLDLLKIFITGLKPLSQSAAYNHIVTLEKLELLFARELFLHNLHIPHQIALPPQLCDQSYTDNVTIHRYLYNHELEILNQDYLDLKRALVAGNRLLVSSLLKNRFLQNYVCGFEFIKYDQVQSFMLPITESLLIFPQLLENGAADTANLMLKNPQIAAWFTGKPIKLMNQQITVISPFILIDIFKQALTCCMPEFCEEIAKAPGLQRWLMGKADNFSCSYIFINDQALPRQDVEVLSLQDIAAIFPKVIDNRLTEIANLMMLNANARDWLTTADGAYALSDTDAIDLWLFLIDREFFGIAAMMLDHPHIKRWALPDPEVPHQLQEKDAMQILNNLYAKLETGKHHYELRRLIDEFTSASYHFIPTVVEQQPQEDIVMQDQNEQFKVRTPMQLNELCFFNASPVLQPSPQSHPTPQGAAW